MRSIALLVEISLILSQPMGSLQLPCTLIEEVPIAKNKCIQGNSTQEEDFNGTDVEAPGCPRDWKALICWPRSIVGEVVNSSCPSFLRPYLTHQGVLYRNCTANGWSNVSPSFWDACELRDDPSEVNKTSFLLVLKQVYTVGYAISIIALVSAIIIFMTFRKLHCTRNYIHTNLFISFILHGILSFIKDVILFSSNVNQCAPPTVTCKGAVTFFHFSMLAESFWILVEGLYLQSLLSLTFVTHAEYFWCYCLVGWGTPTVAVTVWILLKIFIDNEACWEKKSNPYTYWTLYGPILTSIVVNFFIFLNIIRILTQKLRSSGIGGNPCGQYARLTKSTLLLIPLLGIHRILCIFLLDYVSEDLKLHLELGLGSFQGFAVALLYCFLTTEVKSELKERVWFFRLDCFSGLTKRHRPSLSTSVEVSYTYSTQLALLEKPGQPDKSPDYNGSLLAT